MTDTAPATEAVPVQSTYRRVLEMARARAFEIGRENEERIRESFAVALRALVAGAASDALLDDAAGRELYARTLRLLSEFEARFAAAVDASVQLSITEVAALHLRANELLYERAGLRLDDVPGARASLQGVRKTAVDAIMARHQNAATFRTVARRRLQAVVPEIDRLIAASVGAGTSVGTATLDLATVLANQDADLIARLPASLSSSLHRGVGQIDLGRYGLSSSEVRHARSILYDARRIQVSETNNALREANTQSLIASPLVMAATWQRSGRHHVPDSCDVLATVNLYGYGPGVHPVDAFPQSPHPSCGCTQGGPIVSRPLREWREPKPRGRSLEADPAAEELYGQWREQWTPRELERTRETVAELIRSANRARAGR